MTASEVERDNLRAQKYPVRYAPVYDSGGNAAWEPGCNEKVPALLFACRESRAEALRFYTPLKCPTAYYFDLKETYVDLGKDVICVREWGRSGFVNQLTDEQRAKLRCLAVDDNVLTSMRRSSMAAAMDKFARLTGLEDLRFVRNLWQMLKID